MRISLSGDLKVKLPGYKKENFGYKYSTDFFPFTTDYVNTGGKKNGDGSVYNRSDCSYPNVRIYGCGGNCAPGVCDNYTIIDSIANGKKTQDSLYLPECPGGVTLADIIWYGETSTEFNPVVLASKNKVDSANSNLMEYKATNRNWTDLELAIYASSEGRNYKCDENGLIKIK